MGEEAGVGIHAEGDKGDARGEDHAGLVVGNVERVDVRNLLVGFAGFSGAALGEHRLPIGEEVHADRPIEGLGIAGDRNPNQQGQWAMVRRELDVNAEPGKGMSVWMRTALRVVLPVIGG